MQKLLQGIESNLQLAGPRVHVNLLTSAIDANFVYGSDTKTANRLRAFEKGV